METYLYSKPWVSYVDYFFQSQLILKYPKNMIFVAQVLTDHLKKAKKLYEKYPYAEKFDISSLDTIDWQNTVLSINKHLEWVVAPEPVRKLMNLDKRLDFEKAHNFLFRSLQFPLIRSFYLITIITIIFYLIHLFQKYNLLRQFLYL